jgi:hypothetical protein
MHIASATGPYTLGSTTADRQAASAVRSQASDQGGSGAGQAGASGELTPQEQRQVAELQQIDRNVRAHEAAHVAAGRGVVTSGANYAYTYGPDGRQYAIGGEVGIDTAPEQKPEDNIEKGSAIQAAALAPRDPSAQDYRVASIGARLESQGHADLARQRAEETAAPASDRAGRAAGQATPADSDTAADTTRKLLARTYAATDSAPAGPRISLFA